MEEIKNDKKETEEEKNQIKIEKEKAEHELGNEQLKVAKLLLSHLACEIVYIDKGEVRVNFTPEKQFVCDEYKLIHSGLIDSVGQFCALMAVNEPNGIVSMTKTEFMVPIKSGMSLEYEAKANHGRISKQSVRVTAKHSGILVYESIISILVLEEHIFLNNIDDMSKI